METILILFGQRSPTSDPIERSLPRSTCGALHRALPGSYSSYFIRHARRGSEAIVDLHVKPTIQRYGIQTSAPAGLNSDLPPTY
jgi:hypothetical protein